MLKKHFLLLLLSIVSSLVFSQNSLRAYLNEDMTLGVVPVTTSINYPKSNIEQIAGFPLAFPANPSFKNMRNVTLADINGDGIDDIIFTADNKLYAYSFQGIIWEATLTGTAIYPPSIGDINGNGDLEIVVTTGGIPANGRIHVFDKNGNTLTGWPVNFNNNWILCAPTLSDLNNNGKMEIIVNERITPAGRVHILTEDGTSYSNNWPVTLDGIPAVTPSVADIDNDGEKDIIIYSTKSKYVFGLNGQAKTGFPITTAPPQGYSYQSPIIADFDNNGFKEIIGATHGDVPQYYVMKHDGSSQNGWPKNVANNNWTYSTPTVLKINGQWYIFMSRPINDTPSDMLYAWDENGVMHSGFPIVKEGGLEGYISVADINDNNTMDLVFGSNLLDAYGYGYIHAYSINGGNELNGFPLRPKGFTFMNGVCIGDINGNGKINLVALSYTLNFGSLPDSVFINVYELDANYAPEKILWSTYKGHNTRTGYYNDISGSVPSLSNVQTQNLIVYPNPAKDHVHLAYFSDFSGFYNIKVVDIQGKELFLSKSGYQFKGHNKIDLPIISLQQGFYHIIISNDKEIIAKGRFIKK